MIETPPPLQFRTVTIKAAMLEAVQHYQAGRYDEARAICEQLLQQRPKNVDALHLLGVLEIQRTQFAAALPYFEKAVALQDNNAELYSNYGSLLSQLKRPEEALEKLRRAVALKPDYAEAHLNMATVLLDQEDLVGAVDEFRQAMALNGRLADSANGLGCAQSRMGLIPEAIGAFRQAVSLSKKNAAAHCNLAMLLLGAGIFAEGWEEYEWRLRNKDARQFRVPRWKGEPLRGRTLLVASEQGLGDTIQFVRYLPELKKQGAKIVFECRAELKSLFEKDRFINLLIDWPRASDVESGVDFYVPLLSVPMHFGTTLENILSPVPYLAADPNKVDAWRPKVHGDGLKVGLMWSGNPTYVGDRFRTCALTDFAPLAAVPGVTFFSLQKGPGADQAAHPPYGMRLIALGEQFVDFSDTAAAISHLDLVISVDTSVAHLAGAMGKPVWTLLPFAPDWRWLRRREDSPWYPTMRLFRQDRRGDWAGTLVRVAEALRCWRTRSVVERVFRPPQPLDEALGHYHAGRRDQAERCCREILDAQPHHVEALRILGELLIQEGRMEAAIEAFERAVLYRPGEAVLHFNLGVMLVQGGRRDDGIASYRRAVAIDPNHAEAHFNLANALRDDGRFQEAIGHYRQALTARPGYTKAQINLGNALRREEQTDEAIVEFEQLLSNNPGHARAHHSLGLCLLDRGQLGEALAHLQQAADANPNTPEVQNHLGVALQTQERLCEAQACYERAVQLRPGYVEALGNLAGVFGRQGNQLAAETTFRRALEVTPRTPESTCHLARVAGMELGWLDQGVALVREALQARPNWPEAHCDLGALLLCQGKLCDGYAEMEWRCRMKGWSALPLKQPRWDGGDLQGKTILLHAEQGFGDVIQMVRYLPLVIQRGGRVVLGCAQSLVRLLSAMPGVAAAAERIDALPPFDVYASLLSLPYLLRTTLQSIPAEVPYLRVPNDSVYLPQPSGEQLKVGIAWSGNKNHKRDYQRSCSVRFFQRLVEELPNIAFYSLQVETDPPRMEGSLEKVIDLGSQFVDWAATAAAIQQLDLVVSVDTGVAHLAGALAKPVWTLLAYTADPRWLKGRNDSPWYPTMRLFRQERYGDWQGVFHRVAEALAQFEGEPRPLLRDA